jgi:hypothetical protein
LAVGRVATILDRHMGDTEVRYELALGDDAEVRYVLALGDDAEVVERAGGTAVIERLSTVILVEADIETARTLVKQGEYVHVFASPHDALRALALFRDAS